MKKRRFISGILILSAVMLFNGCATSPVIFDRCGTGRSVKIFSGLIGGGQEKVMQVFGKPDSISPERGNKGNVEVWRYKMPCSFCNNPCSGDLAVEFSEGCVTRISYF